MQQLIQFNNMAYYLIILILVVFLSNMKRAKQTQLQYNGVYVNAGTYLIENKKGEIIKEFGTDPLYPPIIHPHLTALECWLYILTVLKKFTGSMVYPYTGAKIYFNEGKPVTPGKPSDVPLINEFPPLRILAGSITTNPARIRKTQGVINIKN